MAPKRAAAAEPKGRAAKAPKVVKAPEPEKVNPLWAVLDMLRKAGVPASCISMMREACPYVLGTQPAERHEYQETFLATWRKILADAEAHFAEDVAAAEAQVAVVAAKGATADAVLNEAKAREEKCLRTKAETELQLQEAKAAKAAASAALDAARDTASTAAAAVRSKAEAKESYEKAIAETFEPVKSGAFSGKDWRAKNKAVDQVAAILAQTAAGSSLAAALPLALKERPEARGSFAQRTIEFGEAALRGHVELLARQLADLEASAAPLTTAVDRAAEVVAARATASAAAEQAFIDAQNEWLDANTQVVQLVHSDLQAEEAAAAAAVDNAKDTLEEFRSRAAALAALAETPEAASAGEAQETAAPADEAAAVGCTM